MTKIAFFLVVFFVFARMSLKRKKSMALGEWKKPKSISRLNPVPASFILKSTCQSFNFLMWNCSKNIDNNSVSIQHWRYSAVWMSFLTGLLHKVSLFSCLRVLSLALHFLLLFLHGFPPLQFVSSLLHPTPSGFIQFERKGYPGKQLSLLRLSSCLFLNFSRGDCYTHNQIIVRILKIK